MVSVRAKYLLVCFCKLHSLEFDMQHGPYSEKVNFILGGGAVLTLGHNMNKLGRVSTR